VFENKDTHISKNEIEPLSHAHTNINSKWIEELNVRLETVKLLKENLR
jgi:hypothetical protein